MIYRKPNLLWAWVCVVVLALCVDVPAQRKSKKKPAQPPTELTKLREEYVKATNEYKASLGKLLPLYENQLKKADRILNSEWELNIPFG